MQCPQCKKPLAHLKANKAYPPFWTIGSRFLRFPFQAEPALIITFSTMLAFSWSGPWLVKWLACFMILLLSCHYGLQSALAYERNGFNAPGLDAVISRKGWEQSLALAICVATAIGLSYSAFLFWSTTATTVIALLVISLLPGILLTQIVNRGSPLNISPLMFYRIVAQLDFRYLQLVGYFFVATSLIIITSDAAGQHLPELAMAPITAFTLSYSLIVLFSVLGHVAAQYHHFVRKELRPPGSPDTSVAMGLDAAWLVETQLDISLKNGDYTKAVELLEQALKRQSSATNTKEQLYRLLRAMHDWQKLEHYSHLFLWHQLRLKQAHEAIRFIKLLRKNLPGFAIQDLELRYKLAKQCLKSKEPKLVLWLAQEAHQRFEASEALAELYLLAAKVLLHPFDEKTKALSYLNFIATNMPDSPSHKSAEVLINHLAQSTPKQ